MNVTGVGGWVKGQSGNRAGARVHRSTSAELELRALAQKWGKKAVATAGAIMEDEKNTAGVRLQAADLLLNRGFGKPIQPHANPDLSPIDWNSMQTEDLLGVLRKIEMQLNSVPDVEVILKQQTTTLGKFDG